MDELGQQIGMQEGDRVALADDDWGFVGHELILVDLEPVPGSTQCVVADGGDRITVNRVALRPL